MTSPGFSLFDTAIGRCAVAWRESGIVGVQFPESSDEKSRAHLARRFPDLAETAPPAEIEAVIGQVRALLAGEPVHLTGEALDMSVVAPFEQRVYEIVLTIPPGRAMTYGEVAERLGDKLLARDVGQAMGRNPFPIIMPCHRVLAAGGKLGGFSAPGGASTKQKLLAIEGYAPGGQPSLFS
jgi:methylated-DNA-[protein]-cysteine S-methyltransferase